MGTTRPLSSPSVGGEHRKTLSEKPSLANAKNLVKAGVTAALISLSSSISSPTKVSAETSPVQVASLSHPTTIDDLLAVYDNSDKQMNIQDLPDPIRANFLKISDAVASAGNLIETTGGHFVSVKTGVQGRDDLGKVIYRYKEKKDTTGISFGTFESFTGMSMSDLFSDMEKNLTGIRSAEELKLTLTGKYIRSVYGRINAGEKNVLMGAFDTFGRTWPNEIDKGILSPEVFPRFRKLFEESIINLSSRKLLTIDTLYLATRTAVSIAYQTSLLYKEGPNGGVVYTGTTARPAWEKRGEHAWQDGRAFYSTDYSVRELLLNPDFQAGVYRLGVKYQGGSGNVDFMFPLDRDHYDFVEQAVSYSVIGKERGKLTDIIHTARDGQMTSQVEDDINASKQRVAESKQRVAGDKKWIAGSEERVRIINEYLALVSGKDDKELATSSSLRQLKDIRDRYSISKGHDSKILDSINQQISRVAFYTQSSGY